MPLPTYDQLKGQYTKFAAMLEEAKADGKITFEEGMRLSVLVTETLESVSRNFPDATHDERRDWVMNMAFQAYRQDLDVDIPFLPEPVETMLEDLILRQVIPAVFDLLVKKDSGE